MAFQLLTMTTEEATQELRSLGMSISTTTLRYGLEQGVYPFGVCIKRENGGPVFQIFRRKFDEWVAERTVEAG